MSDTININPDAPSDDEGSDLISLKDENGREQQFELLDLIDYSGTQYAVLAPVEGEENDDQVLIFEVEDADKETNVLTPVDDQGLADAIFELFRNRNADRFEFD